MATAAERKAYARRLMAILQSLDSVERWVLQESIRLLRELRDSVAGQLAITELDQLRVAEQQRVLDLIIADYNIRLRSVTAAAVGQAFVLGERAAVEPLQQANIPLPIFRASTAQVDVITRFSADLISKISDDSRNRINRVIRLNALAGKSSLESMRDITQELFKTARPPSPTTRRPTKGVAYEAERILRTETNRAFNLAAFGQQQALAQSIPDLQKMWLATGDNRTRDSHLLAHGTIVFVNEPFQVGFSELMFPHDPAGPPQEVINCRCRSITILPDVGRVRLPVDARIEREKASRDLEAVEMLWRSLSYV